MASNSARRGGLTALLVLLATACGEPKVGGKVQPPPAPEGYRLAITGAAIDATSHVVVTFTVTNDAAPVTLADLPALRPSFTLAGLLTDPVSGLATWQSYLLTGSGTLANLPLGGPGTPPAYVLQNQKQPGAVTGTAANLADLGDGRFTVTVDVPLPAGFDPARTMRVGAYLGNVTGTASTSATYDWVPAGGTPVTRDTVLDASCDVCHGLLLGHGRRSGARLCLTCHTTQNADPDTQDPAAPVRALTVAPEARTVVAGTGASTFTATLLASSAAVTWALSPASGAGTLSGTSGASVTYTPPAPDAAQAAPIAVTLTASATITAAATGGYAPPPVTLTAAVAITVVQPPAAPAVQVNPAAQTLVAFGPGVSLSAALLGTSGAVAWTLSPASGAGTLSSASGAAVTYTPPAQVAGPTSVTVTATAGGVSGTATLTVLQGASGTATRFTDPNPLDLGRMVHRIHRGKNLPTLYYASSIAPAPPLPPDGPPPAALPLPFFTGRNAVVPGARWSIFGFRGTEFIGGRVVSRTDNFQPAKVVAEGVGFPRDLRDCDACHRGAPQAAEVVTAISRRTCQGCHPDVRFDAGPGTDLVHFAHPGGPQADDARCHECHVDAATPGKAGTWAPIAAYHQPWQKSPYWNQPVLTLAEVTNFTAGARPTFVFGVKDRVGDFDSLTAPSGADLSTTPSPVPRGLARLSFVVSGPTRDYLTGNLPLSLAVQPLPAGATLTYDDLTGLFSYTPAAALPATVTGTWGVGMEGRRAATVPLYAAAGDAFPWPGTGESVTEYADNPVSYVDTALGAWPPGSDEPRRVSVDRARCQACHLDVSLHGNNRHNPQHCVLCHTPDQTDWSRRPKGPDGNVNLATVYSATSVGTSDNIEERSVHFKVMVHRIHTGEGQGTARIEVAAPHVVSGAFLDDVRFPNRLADCTLCHPGSTWLLEAIPADASPTIANETASITHAASLTHGAADPRLLPMAAACVSCHGTAYAYAHVAAYTDGGVESCTQCHAKGSSGVPTAHGLPAPTAGTSTSR